MVGSDQMCVRCRRFGLRDCGLRGVFSRGVGIVLRRECGLIVVLDQGVAGRRNSEREDSRVRGVNVGERRDGG